MYIYVYICRVIYIHIVIAYCMCHCWFTLQHYSKQIKRASVTRRAVSLSTIKYNEI